MGVRLYPIFQDGKDECDFFRVSPETRDLLARFEKANSHFRRHDFLDADNWFFRIFQIESSYPEVRLIRDFRVFGWGKFDTLIVKRAGLDRNVGCTNDPLLMKILLISAGVRKLTQYQSDMLVGVSWS